MEEHHLRDELLRRVNVYLEENSLKFSRGTIANTASIKPPSSMKNKDKPREPEMNQTRKGNQWYLGMKAHIGVNSKTKLIYAAAATAANVHDSQVPGDLLHGEETRLWGDSAYTGQQTVIKEKEPRAKYLTR